MARIRSVHPGFFTDEALVSVSMAARLLFIGLGVEADDKGVFEWKPITLKMRLFPVDNVDVAALLTELHEVGAIRPYEMEGRRYGAIRNFRVFQRPKTPNDVHPMPGDFRNYVGLSAPVSPSFLPKGEKSPQMEDGGKGKEEGSSVSNETAPIDPAPDADTVFWTSAKGYLGKSKASLIGKWVGEYGKPATAAAIASAQAERAVDPVQYVQGVLRRQGGRQPAIPL